MAQATGGSGQNQFHSAETCPAQEDGTSYTHAFQLEFRGFFRLLERLVGKQSEKQVESKLQALKRILESGQVQTSRSQQYFIFWTTSCANDQCPGKPLLPWDLLKHLVSSAMKQRYRLLDHHIFDSGKMTGFAVHFSIFHVRWRKSERLFASPPNQKP